LGSPKVTRDGSPGVVLRRVLSGYTPPHPRCFLKEIK
jgi:hypothetical protein